MVIETFTERSATQKSSRQAFQHFTKGGGRGPRKTLVTPLPLALSPFVRPRKNGVQTYLMCRRNITSAFRESDGRVRSWLSEAPPMFSSARGFLEREH